MSCDNCGATAWGDDVIDDAEARKAIPFFDRRGWTLGAGAVASLIGLGTVASAQEGKENDAFIRTPIAGDLYELDVARMSDKPEAPVMYSVMRVTGVEKGIVTVQLASLYYNDLRGVQRDVNSGKASRADYYAPDQAVMPRAVIAKMYEDGVISDVVR